MIHGHLSLVNDDSVQVNVSKTTNFLERCGGLLTTPALKKNEGLLIVPCSSVHTFAMRYNLDLVFMDKQLNIVKTVRSLKPWRMAVARGASMVLELPADSIEQLQLINGQQLEWHNDPSN